MCTDEEDGEGKAEGAAGSNRHARVDRNGARSDEHATKTNSNASVGALLSSNIRCSTPSPQRG